MSGKQQGLRYFQKFLNSKASERNALAKKVLRYVLAVGFVLSPWLGGEAYAEGIVPVNGTELSYNDKGTVNIYAQDVKGDVGWNSFTHFNVDAGKIANLHFCKDANGDALNTLVNTVTNQININGTVNAIKKDGTVGGNLYFLSPGGMVVGSTGVINAGSLTVMAPTQKFINNLNFDNLYLFNNIVPLNDSGKITISGQIHASGGVDLRAAYLSISRPVSDNSSFADPSNTNSSATVTAANLFNEVVNLTGNDLGEATALKAVIDAGGKVYLQADKEMTIQNTQINAGGNFDIVARALGTSDTGQLRLENSSIYAVGDLCVDVGGRVDIYNNFALTSDKPSINMYTQTGDIYNYGNFAVNKDLNITAGSSSETESADFTNAGTIQSTGGGVSLTSRNGFTNTGTVQANAQIKFAVGGTLTNQGTIESTSSNVQADIGRNFKNIAVYNNESTENRTLKGGIIEAGGNVQVDYNLDNEGIGVASSEERIDGIYNSGLIWAKGDEDPVYDEAGNISSSGSGNIWLTSAYNITNDGTMKANRQITLNARDFLHNHGLIQGVTYLDIKSIMGYVYNHNGATIKATGGNIDLSSGQANLVIDGDTNGTKKELYRKFTPIIIEGSVEATSALNNTTSETNQGNINIRAYLGDIYVNGGTIEAKAGTRGEVESVAGDVILDAAQNITIGFETESARADDPTTQAGPNGENKDKYERDDEREYYKPLKDTSGNLVSGNAAQISSTNITLTSGSRATNTISISAVNNALTASDSIELNSGGNVTVGAGASVTLGGSLQLQGNNIYVAGVQRSGNPTEPLKVEANGAGGTDSAINSLNLNIAGDVLFNTLNVNTAEVNVSGDLQIKQLHVADQAHFTSNNTMIGVYGEATEPRGDQSDALYRDMGNGSDSWMGINIKSDGYQITNGTEIQNAFAGGTEYPVQMSSKLVDVDPQETLVENYGDVTGNFGRFDLVDDSVRPSGGIESTDQGSQTVLKQDENGLHIETSDNKVDNGPQIEAGDNKVDNGSQIEAGDNKGDQGSQIEAGDDKDDQGSQIEAGDDKENEDSQIEAGDKKKDKSKRDKKDKREKQKKDK